MTCCVHGLEHRLLRCQYCLNEDLFKVISIKIHQPFYIHRKAGHQICMVLQGVQK